MTRTDDLGRTFTWNGPPRRIVSLCPSQTEYLYALGLSDRIVGRTRFCIHPQPAVARARRIGGTKDVDLTRIRALHPDFILAEQEEQRRETVELLAREYPVAVTRVENVADGLSMLLTVGEWVGCDAMARVWHGRIARAFGTIAKAPPLRTAYLIWKNPWMGVGPTTYIDSVLAHLGLINVWNEKMERYPSFELADLKTLGPELVLLSSEPYPFRARHVSEIAAAVPAARVLLVDGEWFSWYGVRMWAAADALQQLVRQLKRSGF